MKKTGIALLLCMALCGTTFAQNSPASPVKVEMIRIPGGTFEMGKQLGAGNDLTPVHKVTLSAFSMSKYPVTQELYYSITGDNPSYFNSDPASGEVQGKRPVENVTWYDAVEFCNKLSQIEGLQPVYTITNRSPVTGYPITGADVKADFSRNGYRLPTEAQWEYAAKGGNPLAAGWKGYKYSGSNTIEDVGWCEDNSDDKTHEVGKKAPNGLGLYDMSGNVWEWCWDWYGAYSSAAQTNPTGAVSGSKRVLRSSSYDRPAKVAIYNNAVNPEDFAYIGESVDRGYDSPDSKCIDVGFRLVRP